MTPNTKPFISIISLIFIIVTLSRMSAQQDSILMFVSHEETYYSEYIVMYEAMTSAGYFVDVRSSEAGNASTYMFGNVQSVANDTFGHGYADFINQFDSLFGEPWNPSLNAVPASVPTNGLIQDVASMTPYKALVMPGGTGAPAYRVDGSYQNAAFEAAALKLNDLAIEALLDGKVVSAQCHGASIPAFWRIPGTTGGVNGLGTSLLEGQNATGFPLGNETAANLANLGVNYLPLDKVVVSSPSIDFMDGGMGTSKIVTTRDWIPQNIAHATRTILNMIESYPDAEKYQDVIDVLVIHGGAVNGCNNPPDIPCNHGTSYPNIPADFDTLINLLNTNSPYDDFNFNVSDLNLFTSNAFGGTDEASILNYLSNYDVVFFYKHWANGSSFTSNFRNAFVDYVDNGGGGVSIHHGLYHHNKSQIATEIFGAWSHGSTWNQTMTDFEIFNTNYGHFVSTFGITYDGISEEPVSVWSGNSNPMLDGSNISLSYYPRFTIFEEMYGNMEFIGSPSFGNGINEINPLFSNNYVDFRSGYQHQHVHGFTRLIDPSGDCSVGKVVYSQSGERSDSYDLNEEPQYAQFLRNAVFWAGVDEEIPYTDAEWTSNSPGTSNWGDASNWNATVPLSCQNVVIPDQAGALIINLPNDPVINIKSLSVGNNVTLNIPDGTVLNVME